MVFAALMLCASLAFSESKTLAVQIRLDRLGYSCNTIDGQWGRKSQSALERYCADRKLPLPATPEEAYDRFFSVGSRLFRQDEVSSADLAALVSIPTDPAEKSRLAHLGYESIKEAFAERGHVSRRTIERLNPGLNWEKIRPGTRITLPDFRKMADDLAAGTRTLPGDATRPEATLVKISLSKFEIAAYDRSGTLLGLFPCSIAKDKSKAPKGELKIVSLVPNPNYTYTPDHTPPGAKRSRYMFMDGPNNPVGVAWLGLSLPGYGIHGTPIPERIGRAESHGCFRLSNWNATRLYSLCRIGTRVIIEP